MLNSSGRLSSLHLVQVFFISVQVVAENLFMWIVYYTSNLMRAY